VTTPDVLLELPLSDVAMLDWEALDRAADAGYRHAMALMEESKRIAGSMTDLGALRQTRQL
jgi:hypothetical protein